MRYLITGGTGTLGQAIIHQLIASNNFDKIISMSRNEKQISDARNFTKDTRINYLVGDVRDLSRVVELSSDVDIIIHCAAMKHIDIAEENPLEASETNILGTTNIIKAANLNSVSKVVFVSTDKASSSNSIYGLSKKFGEKLIVGSSSEKTQMIAFRFGNLVNSNGSVFAKWRLQSSLGEPLTVTDKEMTRFFISSEKAAKFILQKVKEDVKNIIYIPKMNSYKVYDIALNMASSAGINLIGLRSGEVLSENLVSGDERGHINEYSDFYAVSVGSSNLITLRSDDSKFLQKPDEFFKEFNV
jgi:UDP-N-acetylglucosamine 4,6-dehydratase